MSPQYLGPFAALNPLAWQLEAMRLANRPGNRPGHRAQRSNRSPRFRAKAPAVVLATVASLISIPWMFLG